MLARIADIQRTAAAVAVLDVLASLAAVALTNHYSKPEISGSDTIYIAGGRHPVVEQMLEGEAFVDNDVLLDGDDNQLLIITGPNMAGKSTYIRQVGLIVLMAQMGSFVPARVARIGVVDRVFSRIGASDNLARGESTFMVEMIETANILHNATSRSLLVFDEIGRGTSTFDGLSIAWSVCEYLNQKKFRPKCLFATHYHELTELADHRARHQKFQCDGQGDRGQHPVSAQGRAGRRRPQLRHPCRQACRASRARLSSAPKRCCCALRRKKSPRTRSPRF